MPPTAPAGRSLVRTLFRIRGRPVTYTVLDDAREIDLDAVPVEFDRDIVEGAAGGSMQRRRQDWLFDVMGIRAVDGTPQQPAPGDTITTVDDIDAAGLYQVTRVYKVARPAPDLPAFEHYDVARTVWRIHTTLENEDLK